MSNPNADDGLMPDIVRLVHYITATQLSVDLKTKQKNSTIILTLHYTLHTFSHLELSDSQNLSSQVICDSQRTETVTFYLQLHTTLYSMYVLPLYLAQQLLTAIVLSAAAAIDEPVQARILPVYQRCDCHDQETRPGGIPIQRGREGTTTTVTTIE